MTYITIQFDANGGSFSEELLNTLTSDEKESVGVIKLEFDTHDIITLPNNNDITKNNCTLLGWGIDQCDENGIINGTDKKIQNIFKGTYIPTTNITLYAVWCQSQTPEIVINLNKTSKTNIEITPFAELNDSEQQNALTNRISTVTFIAIEEKTDNDGNRFKESYKCKIKYEGSDWTLSQIMADRVTTDVSDTLYIDFLTNNNLNDRTIVWFKKDVKVNTYDLIYDGDILTGIVYPIGDKHLFGLPISPNDQDGIEQYLIQKYDGVTKDNIINIKLEGELYHTTTVDDIPSTNYGTVIIYDNLTNTEIFNSDKNTNEYHINTTSGMEYTLIAEPKPNCRFIGWYRREEVIMFDEKNQLQDYSYLGYYKISGMNDSKINVIIEHKDVYNQFGALFVGKVDNSEYPECPFDLIDDNIVYDYYYWNNIGNTISNVNDIKGITGNTIQILFTTKDMGEYVLLFSESELTANNIKITPDFLQEEYSINDSKPIEYVPDYFDNEIKEYLQEKGCRYVTSMYFSKNITQNHSSITIEINN